MKIRITAPRGVIYHGQRVAKGTVLELKATDKKHAEIWIGAGQAVEHVEKAAKATK